ncbi:transcription factor [Fusarium langsethiae]|uniref:Transcription factor n=1 Tax=Fusarium langsethiae TaxID=179993 RepID=A0A0M9EPW3_FUSLA|nr:transcription factor [Fusarium langsethiae]GKU09057.1 unnamed protein product [Fusarium langsethiae]
MLASDPSDTFPRDPLPLVTTSESGIQGEDDRTTSQDAYGLSGGLASSDSRMWSGFLLRLREAFGVDSQPGEADLRLNLPSSIPSKPANMSRAELQRLQHAVANFPPWPIARFLLNVCIEHGTDSFFYFDQAQLTTDLDRFYHDAESTLRFEASFLCLAFGVFALGSQWTTLIKPQGWPSASMSIEEDIDPGKIFYNTARPLLGDIMDSTSILSIQAAYVLSVYLMPASAIGPSYVYMGLALRKAIALEMHQDKSDAVVGEREAEISRRLWWSIYSLERHGFLVTPLHGTKVFANSKYRTVTIKLNRPSSISQDTITAQLPRPCAEIDSKQKFDNLQLQIANARLVKILDRLLESTPLSTERQKWYETELKNWKRSLPPSTRLDSVHPRSSEYRAVVHLYLNYYFASIALGKVSVVAAVRSHLQSALRPSQDAIPAAEPLDPLCRLCIRSAKKMLQLFEGLTCTDNLTRFSFTDFQGCSIATVILLLGGIIDGEEGDCNSKAVFGLECLRRMTGGNATAMMGVRFVEALQFITIEAAAKLAASRNADHPSVQRPSASDPADYAQWTEWLTKATDDELQQAIIPSRSRTPCGGGPTMVMLRNAQSSFNEGSPERSNLASSNPGARQVEASLQYPIHVDESQAWQTAAHDDPMLAHDFQSTLNNDEHLYLMGLTGLDVLNFDFDMSKPGGFF